MTRFNIFVDGSNLFGSLRNLNLRVEEYEKFFTYILEQAVASWGVSVISGTKDTRLIRVLWYVVGSIDDWDLDDPENEKKIRGWSQSDNSIRKEEYYLLARNQLGDVRQEDINNTAWSIYYNEIKEWYSTKKSQIEKQNDFYFGVESSTDFIDIIRSGHLKVDFLTRHIIEKGIDTSLAVDMLSLIDTYDVALLISGDADSIPSVRKIKDQGKHVGVIEFIKGHPPEKKGRESSSKLKAVADFVVPIYETDLERNNIAACPSPTEVRSERKQVSDTN